MHENKNGTKDFSDADMVKFDAHVITPEEYEEIPELTREWFETADHYRNGVLVRRGRPRKEKPKIRIGLRVDADVLAALKSRGKGWQTLANQALRDWVTAHP